MVRGSIPGRDKRFSLLRSHPYRLLFNGYRGSVQGVKRSGCEVDRSLSSNAQGKTEGSSTSAPPACPRDVERGVLYKTERYYVQLQICGPLVSVGSIYFWLTKNWIFCLDC